jgi:Flp pilus assembly protein TadD
VIEKSKSEECFWAIAMASKKRGDAAASDKDTSSMYLELKNLQALGDFEKALKVCNRILNVSPSDSTAFHCKIVCLINTSKFDVAHQQIKVRQFITI